MSSPPPAASDLSPARALPAVAALSGVLAITLGTFATHGLKDPQAREWVMTGLIFQLPHAAAGLAMIAWRDGPLTRLAAWLLVAGSLVFAVVLDLLALGLPRAIAVAAPIGGTAMLFGWLLVLVVALARPGLLDRRQSR